MILSLLAMWKNKHYKYDIKSFHLCLHFISFVFYLSYQFTRNLKIIIAITLKWQDKLDI
jgi:hypothetical protein